MATSASPSLAFSLDSSVGASSPSSPRVGTLTFHRPSDNTTLTILTPGLILNLDKGVVPCLSQDNLGRLDVPKLKHASLDSFLSLPTPLTTLLPHATTQHPLHSHLVLPPSSTILSLSLPNPTSHLVPLPYKPQSLTAISSKGFHSITPAEYYSAALALKPDILWAGADTRSGLDDGKAMGGKDKPNPEKQEQRGAERTMKWVGELAEAVEKRKAEKGEAIPVLWTELVGGANATTREKFSSILVSSGLDEHLGGYTLPLPSLRTRIDSPPNPPSRLGVSSHPLPNSPLFLPKLIPLAQASLSPLPVDKPRLASGALSPHETLALVGDAGLDLFDGTMAYEATEMGVALDFVFPVPASWGDAPDSVVSQREVGISLYDTKYELDFSPLVVADVDEPERVKSLAMDPERVENPLVHCEVSAQHPPRGEGEKEEPFSKAYIHHLLMAHELLAPILLQSHNLAHLQTFLSTIRRLLLSSPSDFARERARFEAFYDGGMGMLEASKTGKEAVKRERGKGSMGSDRSGGGGAGLDATVGVKA